MKLLKYLFVILFLLQTNFVKSQGCSDAGFCSMGSIKLNPVDTSSIYDQKLSVNVAGGIGDESVVVFTAAVQYEKKWNSHLLTQAKITGNYASGNLGQVFGIGDLFISGSYSFKKKHKWESSILVGIKLPLNKSNLSAENKDLPMQYQSSLGTVDFIGGLSVTNQRWLFALAIQQPISNLNENKFLPSYWSDSRAIKYPATYNFKRKGDVLGRITYTYSKFKKIKLSGGLLGIYHLGKDTYFDINKSTDQIEIKGSDGLTLNATLGGWIALNSKLFIGFTGGIPLIVREIRPDGLTRSIVASPEIIYKF